ncbi:MAG: sigma-70 family RNA polymerase sigma factor [Acidobacteria bacterium]|nr:MAG: sigma-70 family RNA polymerase sigma factor [Acidobacteriota bacterium]
MDIPVMARLSEAGLSDANRVDRESSCWTEEAFQGFFLENYARLVGVIFRIVGDYPRAEGLTDEAFWRLYRQPCGGNKFNPSGWIYRTASRLAIDSLRAEARRGRIEQEAGPLLSAGPRPDPLDAVLEAERCAQVRNALAFLRPLQAQLLILRASGFSYQELAETLKVKAGSVGTRLIRAEAAFRKSYLKLYGK